LWLFCRNVLIPPGKRRVAGEESQYIKSEEEYRKLQEKSLNEPESFWGQVSRDLLTWSKPFEKVLAGSFAEGSNTWFEDGKLNVAFNCIDRHIHAGHGDRVALLWEGDEPADNRRITFSELLVEVCKLAALLQSYNLDNTKDTVTLYMPMVPETVFVMLACARLGLPHNVVFAGFSAESLRDRISDAKSSVVFTADYGKRGGKKIPLKSVVDEALSGLTEGNSSVKHYIVLYRQEQVESSASVNDKKDNTATTNDNVNITNDNVSINTSTSTSTSTSTTATATSWNEALLEFKNVKFVEPIQVNSEHPLFMLYTSGSTGKPKGLLHTSGGYLTYAAYTTRNSFDLHPEAGDVFGCLADVGWITGHTYIVYGPLALGATTVLFESIPTYPTPSRYWETIDRLKITQLYTAPTVIRALRKYGEDQVRGSSLKTLRVLGSVGEPINPDAWLWYWKLIGQEECSVIDTFWQTETGGHVIAPLPNVHSVKPGAAGFPCIGIDAVLLDPVDGKELTGNDVEGVLCIRKPWPGLARTIFGDHERFRNTYFSTYPGYYFTGDAAHRDSDGHLWIRGRVDDVINVSGHRLSTAEIEAALGKHESCAEAAVLGRSDEITGQSIWAFCILKQGNSNSEGIYLFSFFIIHARINHFLSCRC
jgi:acetyl-CoA synthetase